MRSPVRIALLAVAALALVGPATAPAQVTRLVAVVGPGFAITLQDASGARVTRLDPGTYTVAVDDRAEEHNFHLKGPGVDERTELEFVGQVTWTVTLVEGKYHFQCDPHSSQMKGDFVVGNPAAAPPPAAAPVRLLASVGPGFTIGVRTPAGAAVKTVRAGAVTLVVADRSKIHDFHLTGPGVNRRTAVPFVGTQTWKLTLKKGVYRFVCDPHASAMRGSFRVT